MAFLIIPGAQEGHVHEISILQDTFLTQSPEPLDGD